MCVVRYIGFLTRCALSKPYPELSIINTINAMSLATGRIPDDLAKEVFGDSSAADQLAYSGRPTTRPHQLRTMPFTAVMPPRRTGQRDHNEQHARQQRANDALERHLSENPLRARISSMLRRINATWDINDHGCRTAVCLFGVWRDRGYEKVWDSREDGFLVPTDDWSTNCHVFACAWNEDSMTPVDPLASSSQSMPSASSSSSSSSQSMSTGSTQRAPFEHHEVIAYGLVKRWILVAQQKGVRRQGEAVEELTRSSRTSASLNPALMLRERRASAVRTHQHVGQRSIELVREPP